MVYFGIISLVVHLKRRLNEDVWLSQTHSLPENGKWIAVDYYYYHYIPMSFLFLEYVNVLTLSFFEKPIHSNVVDWNLSKIIGSINLFYFNEYIHVFKYSKHVRNWKIACNFIELRSIKINQSSLLLCLSIKMSILIQQIFANTFFLHDFAERLKYRNSCTIKPIIMLSLANALYANNDMYCICSMGCVE